MRARPIRAILAGIAVLLAGAMIAPGRAADGLGTIRAQTGLAVDGGTISVSGVSSGGYMAGQYHLAHSTKVMGAGIVAAGPYGCAGTTSFWCDFAPGFAGFWLPYDSCQAVHMCTATAREEFGTLGLYFGPPGHADAVDIAVSEAGAGRIDPLSGLKGDRVWLFSGTADRLVRPPIVDDLHAFYKALYARPEVDTPSTAIAYKRDLAVEHAMVVDIPAATAGDQDKANDRCLEYGPPFINDCSYDAAGRMLTFLHGLEGPDGGAPADPAHGDWRGDGLFAFDQTPFFDTGLDRVSLNQTGHLYVPAGCRDGTPCPLHVAFHGCRQHEAVVRAACGDGTGDNTGGDCPLLLFFRDAGYNEWAEAHDIVVLYPQATAWGDSTAADKNPRGCWDWWGYSGEDYFRKTAPQIEAVDRMIDCLTGAGPCG